MQEPNINARQRDIWNLDAPKAQSIPRSKEVFVFRFKCGGKCGLYKIKSYLSLVSTAASSLTSSIFMRCVPLQRSVTPRPTEVPTPRDDPPIEHE